MGGGLRYLASSLGLFVLGCGVQLFGNSAIANDFIV
jgi:hypothetical protein